MLFIIRRLVVVFVALSVGMSLMALPSGAAPRFRDRARTTKPNPNVQIYGSGWGHGVGMSQYGAYAQARAGRGYGRILKHYYRGIRVPTRTMPRSIRVGLAQSMTFSNVKAVSGNVPWQRCTSSGCSFLARQPQGTTWKVQLVRRKDGSLIYRVMQGSTVKLRVGSGARLAAAFNPKLRSGGSVVEAYNPNGSRRRYKWGKLEYSVASASNRRMFMVLDIRSMEHYLRGLGEVPSSWGIKGMAALQAQATAGRTYALRMHRRANGNHSSCRCSLLATPLNQAYVGYDKETEYAGSYWVRAVNSTAGRVATYNGNLISTFYSSSHGGRSENVQDSWAYTGASPTPYLRSVDDPWSLRASSGNPYRSWRQAVRNRRFARFSGSGLVQTRRVRIVGRTAGGSPKKLRVVGVDSNGRKVRATRSGPNGIAAIALRNRFGLRSQQVRRIGFLPFRDDDGKAHEFASLYAHRANIIKGVSKTRFAPGRKITKAKAAVFMYRTFKLPAPTRDYYTDDNNRSAYVQRAINSLAEAGVFPTRTRRFRPGRVITRGQAAIFFRNALKLRRSPVDYFTDDDGTRAEPAINSMRRKGLMSGCGGRRFCPGRAMRRGTMATLIHTTVEAYR